MINRSNKGVTLFELVIVMVIIVITAVLMVPNIGVWAALLSLEECSEGHCFDIEDGSNESIFNENGLSSFV